MYWYATSPASPIKGSIISQMGGFFRSSMMGLVRTAWRLGFCMRRGIESTRVEGMAATNAFDTEP
jgi:hypothetical protein